MFVRLLFLLVWVVADTIPSRYMEQLRRERECRAAEDQFKLGQGRSVHEPQQLSARKLRSLYSKHRPLNVHAKKNKKQ